MTLQSLSDRLASGQITSRQLVEECLAAIDDPQGEGARTYLAVHREAARTQADRIDARRRAGEELPPLAGIPVSIKDLFDEAGVVTLGGSKVRIGTPPAQRDSAVVERLRAAGLVIGTWVELMGGDGQWLRVPLTWATPHGTLFMFTSPAGTAHSMSRRTLERLRAQGQVRVVAGRHVVDEALDLVARAALRNSLSDKP